MKKLIKFSEITGKLKVIERSGWISHAGIDEPESVADHTFRCAILAMYIGDMIQGIDAQKLIRMLLLHDLQEAFTGDIDSYVKDRVGVSEVKRREEIATREILSFLPAKLKEKYLSILDEFRNQTSSEAVIANDIDKFEMVTQALEYEKRGHNPKKLDSFWISAQDKIRTPMIQDLLRMLRRERRQEKH